MRFLLLLLLLIGTPALGGEREQTDRIAQTMYGAQTEVRLWDGTRVDILTKDYAFEVDWPWKWAEGIGQCLYYAQVTGRKPGLILLVDKADSRSPWNGLYRAQTVCAKYGITLVVEVYDSRRQ